MTRVRAALLVFGLGMAMSAAAIVGLRAEAPLLTVPELIAQHAAFDGRVVRVHGFLSQCAGEDCVFRSAPFDGRDPRAWHMSGGRLLSIGPDRNFDAQTTGFANRPVVIHARFRDDCLRGPIICFDRAPTLQPLGPRSLIPDKEP